MNSTWVYLPLARFLSSKEFAPLQLPALSGPPIRVSFRQHLFAPNGDEVHAGAAMRARAIVLRSRLRQQPQELRRILLHELFHFVWLRLGNAARNSFANLLREEIAAGVCGELGLSADWRKQLLQTTEGRPWREYVRESFCDTGAYVYAASVGADGREDGPSRHPEWTLPLRACKARRRWFLETFGDRPLSV